MGCSSSHPTTRVVIIGGGYGGITLAQSLDGKVNVTVVERRTTLNHNVANLRCVVRPEWTPLVEIPYTHALPKGGRVVHGEVTDIRDGQVFLRAGEPIPYDFVVIATGASMRAPGKLPSIETGASREYFVRTRQQIEAANHITIIGGGAVGLELAGEIRSVFPTKQIVIVNSQPRLLATEGELKPKFHAKLAERLAVLKINVLLGERVVAPGAGADQATQGFIAGHTTLRTEKGTAIETDLQIWTAGGARANSGFLATSFGTALDPATGRVRVNQFGQVQGQNNVFALGDVAQLPVPEQALAYYAGEQAKAVAGNILALLDKKGLKAYKPHGPVMFLPLGPTDGLGQAPFGVVGPGLVSSAKGKNLFVNKYWKALHAPAPAVPRL